MFAGNANGAEEEEIYETRTFQIINGRMNQSAGGGCFNDVKRGGVDGASEGNSDEEERRILWSFEFTLC